MNGKQTKEKGTPLRTGFSTGACTAAVCVAAWLSLEKSENKKVSKLIFPDGKERELELLSCAGGLAKIIKDGGDDPDVTHGMEFSVQAEECLLRDQQPEDYLLSIGKGRVILRGVEGVGKCTRAGLDCEKGKWAINIGPRQMITNNLTKAGFGKKESCILLSITAKNGTRIGAKTLNPTLGIMGGISILGTSGIVHPYSHKAYIDTIKVQVRAAMKSGSQKIVFATGGRTKRGAQTVLKNIADDAFICIADFIADSLREAENRSVKETFVACMPGKLCKYAMGVENTHAHKNSLNMGVLIDVLKSICPNDKTLPQKLEGLPSVRSALDFLPDSIKTQALKVLAEQALKNMKKWNPNSVLRIMVFDFEGEHLFTTGDEE